jgi:glycerol kinase
MIIGIDQGTTGTLGILMDPEGNVLESRYLTHRQIQPQPGWVEHNALEIWANVECIVKDLAAVSGGAIRGIGIANQGETVLAWNRKTSDPLCNAIVWQDTRTQAWIDEISADPSCCNYVANTTGLHLDSYFSAGKMRWILQNVPAAQKLAGRGELCFGTLDAWLIWKFTCGQRFLTDASTAARTQLMRLSDLAYDSELLDLFEIAPSCLPEIVDCDTAIEIQGFGAGLDGVPITASLVDQPAAVFGHACLRSGQSKATYGTGCFVYVNAGGAPPPVVEGLLSTLAWSRAEDRVYALDGGVIAVASILTWLKDQIGILEDARRIDELLAGHSPAGGVTCVTAHAGLGSPVWDRNARAAWLGMDLATDKKDLIYSVLEGIAFRVSQVIDAMEGASGSPIEALRVDGGLSQCGAMMQLQANLLGIPVEVVAETEATARGIAFFAARSLGLWNSDTEIENRVSVDRTFDPQWNTEAIEACRQKHETAQQLARTWEMP